MSAQPARRHRSRRVIAVLSLATAMAALAPAVSAFAADSTPWQIDTVEPRAYGHTIGDLVQRQVVIHVPTGYTLNEETLPTAGRRGGSIELRRLTRELGRDGSGSRLTLTLDYQVFVAPREVRTLELPPFVLGFQGAPRPQDLRVEAWPLTVSPLVPVDVSPRRGLGELQPDAPPPLIDTRAGEWRLAAYGLIAALLLAYLALVYIGLPWFWRRQRPFTSAWRALKAMPELAGPESASSERRRLAFQQLHDALNQTAGEVVFEQTIDRFIAAHPRFAGLRGDLAVFFQRSRTEFFGGAAAMSDSASAGAWLTEFCRKCRDAERGAA
ncbi:MAG: hypothetical protein ACKVOX_11715 [Rhizobacter sp.]|jgi:mxaA protein